MNRKRIIDKTMVARAVISKIQDETKPEVIKAKHIKEYDMPSKISIKGENNGYIPDIAISFKEKTHVYEIELDKKMATEKWRLLSLYAKKNNGNLYLVVPDYLKEDIKKEIQDNNINAGLIYFNT